MLEERFHLSERGTTVRTEVLGGVSTFLTMSYILFVNPAILSAAGLPFRAVAVATAIGAAVTTAAMGLIANYPFALASGLGLNAVIAFDVILGRKLAWPVGMALIVIEGLLALVLVPGRAPRGGDARHPALAEAGDRRGHRAVHHAGRPAGGRRGGQRPGHRHRPRGPQRRAAAHRPRRRPGGRGAVGPPHARSAAAGRRGHRSATRSIPTTCATRSPLR